ncbi:hypothetical protein Scep_022614 [Stephania cephalantha]|uniref:Uncharacterized protein n=1 Tax=Stephania cephalantha TaxID=152367 RepID=A0AAP0F8A9_9MAGN
MLADERDRQRAREAAALQRHDGGGSSGTSNQGGGVEAGTHVCLSFVAGLVAAAAARNEQRRRSSSDAPRAKQRLQKRRGERWQRRRSKEWRASGDAQARAAAARQQQERRAAGNGVVARCRNNPRYDAYPTPDYGILVHCRCVLSGIDRSGNAPQHRRSTSFTFTARARSLSLARWCFAAVPPCVCVSLPARIAGALTRRAAGVDSPAPPLERVAAAGSTWVQPLARHAAPPARFPISRRLAAACRRLAVASRRLRPPVSLLAGASFTSHSLSLAASARVSRTRTNSGGGEARLQQWRRGAAPAAVARGRADRPSEEKRQRLQQHDGDGSSGMSNQGGGVEPGIHVCASFVAGLVAAAAVSNERRRARSSSDAGEAATPPSSGVGEAAATPLQRTTLARRACARGGARQAKKTARREARCRNNPRYGSKSAPRIKHLE